MNYFLLLNMIFTGEKELVRQPRIYNLRSYFVQELLNSKSYEDIGPMKIRRSPGYYSISLALLKHEAGLLDEISED